MALAILALAALGGAEEESDEIFSDGFESGDSSNWSVTLPPEDDPPTLIIRAPISGVYD